MQSWPFKHWICCLGSLLISWGLSLLCSACWCFRLSLLRRWISPLFWFGLLCMLVMWIIWEKIKIIISLTNYLKIIFIHCVCSITVKTFNSCWFVVILLTHNTTIFKILGSLWMMFKFITGTFIICMDIFGRCSSTLQLSWCSSLFRHNSIWSWIHVVITTYDFIPTV